jgi:hypothetical protein
MYVHLHVSVLCFSSKEWVCSASACGPMQYAWNWVVGCCWCERSKALTVGQGFWCHKGWILNLSGDSDDSGGLWGVGVCGLVASSVPSMFPPLALPPYPFPASSPSSLHSSFSHAFPYFLFLMGPMVLAFWCVCIFSSTHCFIFGFGLGSCQLLVLRWCVGLCHLLLVMFLLLAKSFSCFYEID